MQRIAERGRRIRAVRSGRCGLRKDVPALGIERLPVQRTPHGEHELDVVIVPHGRDFVEKPQCVLLLTKAQQGFPKAD